MITSEMPGPVCYSLLPFKGGFQAYAQDSTVPHLNFGRFGSSEGACAGSDTCSDHRKPNEMIPIAPKFCAGVRKWLILVTPGRFELPTRSLGNCCSIHLSYGATCRNGVLLL